MTPNGGEKVIDIDKLKYDLAMNVALAEVIRNNGVGSPAGVMPLKFLQAYRIYNAPEKLPELENILRVVNQSE